MKTPLFFIAALAAFFALPIDFTVLCSALFAAGLMAILMFDYRRTHRRIAVPAAASIAGDNREHLRLAA